MNKIEEKKIHEEVLEKNDLMEWGRHFWVRVKQGNVISKRFALVAVAIGAAIALWILISRGGKTNDVAAWRDLETRGNAEALDEFAKAAPDTTVGRVARLQKARLLLGPLGVTQLNAINPDTRGKAIKSIEEARDVFTKLVDDFKNDLTLQAECLEGAAQSELALVGIPKEGTPPGASDYRGNVDKVIELYDRIAKLAGEENLAGKAARKKATDLSNNKGDVAMVQDLLYRKFLPQPGLEPKAPPSLTPTPPVPPVNIPAPVIPEAPKK